jgi:hypothetical protein
MKEALRGTSDLAGRAEMLAEITNGLDDGGPVLSKGKNKKGKKNRNRQ